MVRFLASVALISIVAPALGADQKPALNRSSFPWLSDQGDGTYKNPVLFADYSDPDAVRVGDDYYLVASTFAHAPGLTLLHSRDLVNWQVLTDALDHLVPDDHFAIPRQAEGVWAPALRYYDGKFWIFYPDPDFGIYVINAKNAAGPWSAPALLKAGKGLIDPCPFWDDDGHAWFIHGWAKSRAGVSNRVTLCEMAPDASRVLGDGVVIIDGDKIPNYRTLEGPKMYKRAGYYYVFAPAGGVPTGWQSVFRSKTLRGPYENRIVLAQGSTPINGPHQGAWVETPAGESWFLHFQERLPFGRILHLQPVRWADDWPVMGQNPDSAGKGEPVLQFRKPQVGQTYPIEAPQLSDEFDGGKLGPQWSWEANPHRDWVSLLEKGKLRLFAQPLSNPRATLWTTPSVLTQRLQGPDACTTTVINLSERTGGSDLRAGLVVLGSDYAWIGLKAEKQGVRLVRVSCIDSSGQGSEQEVASLPWSKNAVAFLRVVNRVDGECQFSYSNDGKAFTSFGPSFTAKPLGRWVGARIGLFAVTSNQTAAKPHADFAWFHVTAP